MQSTKDIIKILPFNEEFKTELLSKFDTMTEDQQVAVVRAVWDLFDALYEVRLDENMKAAFAKAEKNEEKLDQDFYERVREQTDQQFQKNVSETETTVDLSSTREELQKILSQTSK